LEDAFHHQPDSLTFALGFARILYAEEDYAAARRILKPFADQKDGDTRFLKFLGDISQKLEQYLEAVSYYRRYIEGQGLSTGVLNALGQCFYQLGNPEEALGAWEKSLEMNPEQPEVKKMVDSLK
jgi:tetratricopeptide (TPR) repeat protein